MQHFYHKEIMTLSFLHRWDYCWKCEFDIDVKIENYNHHDGEQLLFYKKVHIKTQSKKKDVLVIFILLQETKNSNLFDKNCAQENVKCHNLTWRKLNWMNRNWTGQGLFGRSKLDAFWENEGKIHDEGCVKDLFSFSYGLVFRNFITD